MWIHFIDKRPVPSPQRLKHLWPLILCAEHIRQILLWHHIPLAKTVRPTTVGLPPQGSSPQSPTHWSPFLFGVWAFNRVPVAIRSSAVISTWSFYFTCRFLPRINSTVGSPLSAWWDASNVRHQGVTFPSLREREKRSTCIPRINNDSLLVAQDGYFILLHQTGQDPTSVGSVWAPRCCIPIWPDSVGSALVPTIVGALLVLCS